MVCCMVMFPGPRVKTLGYRFFAKHHPRIMLILDHYFVQRLNFNLAFGTG